MCEIWTKTTFGIVSFLLLYRCKICIIRRIHDRRYTPWTLIMTQFVSAVKSQKICTQVWLLDLLRVILFFWPFKCVTKACKRSIQGVTANWNWGTVNHLCHKTVEFLSTTAAAAAAASVSPSFPIFTWPVILQQKICYLHRNNSNHCSSECGSMCA
jgi:hypothetical protein